MSAAPKLSKIERLRVAGAIAPGIRAKDPGRKFKVVGPDGKVNGEVTDRELLASLAKRAEIEIAVLPGKRPTQIVCACGEVRRIAHGGPIPKACASCTSRERNKLYRKDNKARLLEMHRRYRKANKDDMYEATRKWRAENRDRVRELNRKWYQKHPEVFARKAKKWRDNNPDKRRERARRWRAANPEKIREYKRSCRARKKAEREAAKKAGAK